jgi:hypothetical protein
MPDHSIQIDPRSRMFNPYDPDREPMPMDDPASHEFMHQVDGKRGYPHWHANGDVDDVQNPHWQAFLPLDEEGVLVLDAHRAVQLALLHSDAYQRQLETLYLSALDVSFERFRFDTQYFGNYNALPRRWPVAQSCRGAQSVLTAEGLPVLQAQTVLHHRFGVGRGFRQLAGLAILRPEHSTARTRVGLYPDPAALAPCRARPRAGTSDVVGTYVVGECAADGALSPGFLCRDSHRAERRIRCGSARRRLWRRARRLHRTRQQCLCAFGRRRGFTGGTGAGQAGGFMGLLQTEQEIRNEQDNLNSLRSNYFRLLANLQELMTTIPEQSESIVRQRLQVAQARTAMLNAESRLLNSKTAYQSQLDAFKITLGLPPDICVRVADPMLERVSLIDPKIRPIQDRVSDLQQRVGDVILELLPSSEQPMVWNEARHLRLLELRDLLNEVEAIRRQLMEGDDAQISRILADGMKLARKLHEALGDAFAEATGQNGDPNAAAQAQQDLELLEKILQQSRNGMTGCTG